MPPFLGAVASLPFACAPDCFYHSRALGLLCSAQYFITAELSWPGLCFITAEHSVCYVLHSILYLPSCRGLDCVLSLPSTWSVVFCTVFHYCRAVVAWTMFYHCRTLGLLCSAQYFIPAELSWPGLCFITAEHLVCCVLHSISSLPSCRGLDYVLSLPNTWSVVFCTVFYHCRAVVAWTVFYHCRTLGLLCSAQYFITAELSWPGLCFITAEHAVCFLHLRCQAHTRAWPPKTVGAPLAHCPALGLDFLSSPHYVLGEGLLTGHQSNTCVRGDLLFLQTCRHFTASSPAGDPAAVGVPAPPPLPSTLLPTCPCHLWYRSCIRPEGSFPLRALRIKLIKVKTSLLMNNDSEKKSSPEICRSW